MLSVIVFNFSNVASKYKYPQTGQSRLDQIFEINDGLSSGLNIIIFFILSVVVFNILKIGNYRAVAFILTLLFVTSGPILIIYFSAPVYNLLSKVFILTGFLFTYHTLIHRNLKKVAFKIKLLFSFSNCIIVFYLLYTFTIYIGVKLNIFSTIFFMIIVTIIIYFLSTKFINIYNLVNEFYFVTSALGLLSLLILDSLFGQTRLFNIFFFLLFFILLLFSKIKVKLNVRIFTFLFVIFATTLILKYNSGLKIPMTFYPLTSLQNSSFIMSGSNLGLVQLGIDFSDIAFSDFSAQLQERLGNTKSIFYLLFLFSDQYITNFILNIYIVFQSGFLYLDPIFNFPDSIIKIIQEFGRIFSPFSFFCAVISPIIVYRIKRILSLYIFSIIVLLIFLPLISRFSFHQYWFNPLYGLWSTGFTISVILKSKFFNSLNQYNLLMYFRNKNFWRINSVYFILLIIIYLISFSKISFNFFTTFGENFSVNSINVHQKFLESYSILPKYKINPLNEKTEQNFTKQVFYVPRGYELLHVEFNQDCSNSNLQFSIRSSQRKIPIRLGVEVYEEGSVYIPLITNDPKTYMIFEIIKSNKCVTRTYLKDNSMSKNPLFAVLSTNNNPVHYSLQENNLKINQVKNSKIKLNYLLNDSRNLDNNSIIETVNSFNGRLIFSNYNFVELDKIQIENIKSNLSAQVLGVTNQGRIAKDIWRSDARKALYDGSVKVTGTFSRGPTIVGLVYGRNSIGSTSVPYSNYKVFGTSYKINPINKTFCFPIQKNTEYSVFIGGISDLLSINWIDIEIKHVIESNTPCNNEFSHNNSWISTL